MWLVIVWKEVSSEAGMGCEQEICKASIYALEWGLVPERKPNLDDAGGRGIHGESNVWSAARNRQRFKDLVLVIR